MRTYMQRYSVVYGIQQRVRCPLRLSIQMLSRARGERTLGPPQ